MAGTSAVQLGWREILGLRDVGGREWRLVRASQLAEMSRHSLLPLISTILTCGLIALNFWNRVPPLMIGAWLALLVMTSASIAVSRRANLGRKIGASRSDLVRTTTHCAIVGLFWSIPPLFFVPFGSFSDMLLIAGVGLTVMGGATLLLAVLPLAGISIVAMVGTSLAVMFARLGLGTFAGLTLLYAVCLTYAVLTIGRSLILRLYNDIALEAQREVVSLMLRDEDGREGDWLWQIDARKCIVDPSPRFASAMRMPADRLAGMHLFELLAGPGWRTGEIGDDIRVLVDKVQRGETFRDFLLPVAVDGQRRWWKLSGTPHLNADRRVIGYRGVIADVTDRQATERRTHRMAHFDVLTGLPNRAHINQLLQERIVKSTETGAVCAYLLIDLDRFKQVNDTLGHPVGDRLLEQVAQRLSALLRPHDKCGRLGGDEFAMVIADAGSQVELEQRAATIIATLSEPYRVGDHILHIGASIGSALYPRDGGSAPTLLRNADLALYRAKENGRGVHARYRPALLHKAEERRAIEVALRGAIEQREFRLVYQPVVNFADRKVVGFEALLRWTNEVLGEITPAKFIPIAEETRLIDSIGEWVFRTACAEAASWPHDYRLAVNLSAGQLRNPSLGAMIVAAMSDAGLDPARLELETTEAVLGEGNEQALRTIDQLRRLGVTVALDDFGTGHSTLSCIGQIPFNSIKVDRNFIRDAESGSRASVAVIRAVVAMADSLEIVTVAEGIETEAQFALAGRLGCRQAQGHLFDRPMDADAVRRTFDTRSEAAA